MALQLPKDIKTIKTQLTGNLQKSYPVSFDILYALALAVSEARAPEKPFSKVREVLNEIEDAVAGEVCFRTRKSVVPKIVKMLFWLRYPLTSYELVSYFQREIKPTGKLQTTINDCVGSLLAADMALVHSSRVGRRLRLKFYTMPGQQEKLDRRIKENSGDYDEEKLRYALENIPQ